MAVHRPTWSLLLIFLLAVMSTPVGAADVIRQYLSGEVYDAALEPCGLLLVTTALEGAVYVRSNGRLVSRGPIASHLTSPAAVPGNDGMPVIAVISPDSELIVLDDTRTAVYGPGPGVRSSVVVGDPGSRSLIWVSGGQDLTITVMSIESDDLRQLKVPAEVEVVGAARGEAGLHIYWVDGCRTLWSLYLCDKLGPGRPQQVFKLSSDLVARIKVGRDGNVTVWDGPDAILIIRQAGVQSFNLRLPGASSVDWCTIDDRLLVAALLGGDLVTLKLSSTGIEVERCRVGPRSEGVLIDSRAEEVIVVMSDGRIITCPISDSVD